ncbi:MAG TPA: helix-turn-helix transcriptional regulator [Chromatiaceae bacterium]|nr:helix-turn-helix transcriptional regulator [Chromatiaceae bacterium]
MGPEEAFGLVLRDLRRERSLSQEALALESQLDRTFISLLERGLRQPSLTTIFHLARTLGLSPEDLVAMVSKVLSQSGEVREAP